MQNEGVHAKKGCGGVMTYEVNNSRGWIRVHPLHNDQHVMFVALQNFKFSSVLPGMPTASNPTNIIEILSGASASIHSFAAIPEKTILFLRQSNLQVVVVLSFLNSIFKQYGSKQSELCILALVVL